jgi:hypothetical protein
LTILAVPGLSGADSVVLVPVADATVWQGNPGSDYGSSNELTVGFATGWCSTLIEFDLSPLAGTTIIDATLWLKCWDLLGSVPAEDICSGRNNADWNESYVIWNNKPDCLHPVSIPAGMTEEALKLLEETESSPIAEQMECDLLIMKASFALEQKHGTEAMEFTERALSLAKKEGLGTKIGYALGIRGMVHLARCP